MHAITTIHHPLRLTGKRVLLASPGPAGVTMFHTINYEQRSLEIGGTLLHPDAWGNGR